MAGRYQLVKRYERFLGNDLRSSEVTRSPEAASSTQNVELLRTGSLTARRGFKAECATNGGLGLAKYSRTDLTTGAVTTEILNIGADLYKQTMGSIALAYTGAAASITCSILADATTSTIVFSFEEDGTETFTTDLGVGYDEVAPVTLADLKVLVDALADYSMTITGTTTVPAAFLPTLSMEPFTTGALSVSFCYESTVNEPSSATNPFATTATNRNTDEFTICSWVNKDNVIYIGSKYDELKKYDGQKVYRAGMPQPSGAPVLANGGAGLSPAGVHQVFYSYVQEDKQGNRVEGDPSTVASITLAGASIISVTVANIQNTTGFNTDMAQVNGIQAGVTTITVDVGHTLKVGDIAYLYDTATSAYVTRTLTAVAATTITFVGVVSVADNQIISANLRIAIYVTAAGGTTFYLAAEVPNLSSSATQGYNFSLTDATLSSQAQYIDFALPHTLPPKMAYLTIHQGLVCGAGILAQPNTVYFSDIDGPEYWPEENSFDCVTVANDSVSGLAPANEFLAVFKKNAHFLVSGLLAATQYRVDLVSTDIGCVAHATIKEVRGRPVFCSRNGPYRLPAGGIAEAIGEDIFPVFSTPAFNSDYELILSRAVAENDEFEEKYILYLPTESDQGGTIYANDNSRTFVWDYYRERVGGGLVWFEWSNINASGGMVVDGDELRWVEVAYSVPVSTSRFNLYRRGYRNDQYDQADHAEPIQFDYVTGWESLGEPSVYKKALRIKVFSIDPVYSSFFTLQVRTERSYIASVYDTDLELVFGSGDGSSGWSFTPWSSVWGDPAAPALQKKLKANKCTALRYTFSHDTLYERPLVSGWETEFVAPFNPAIKE